MKKLFFALAIGALFFASCQKQESDSKPHLTKFSYAMSGTSMYTKAVSSADVLGAINATLPESMAIVLKSSTTGKNFTTRTGGAAVIPSDTYRVSGSMGGEPVTTTFATSETYLASTPRVDINQDITVTDDVAEYILNGTYGCFALVVDTEEVEKAIVTTSKGDVEIPFVHSGTSGIIFGQGDFSSTYLSVRVIPIDTDKYKETTFTLSTKSGLTNVGFVEFGKYYLLHPTADGEQPKCFPLDLPSFVEGELNL